MNTRLVSSRIINAVTSGASLADVLPPQLEKIKDARDRALVQAITYGVCRYYDQLDIILSKLLKKPMRGSDSDVFSLILCGLYQLIYMRIPEHAAVSETVNATQKLKKPWSRGFVNAILREYLRNKDKISAEIENDEEAHFSHPLWILQKIKNDWPDSWQEILKANNEHPPFSLRVNLNNLSRQEYIHAVTKWATQHNEEFSNTIITETDSGLILTPPVTVEELPGFEKGDISVQDGAAQLAANLLQLKGGQRVLDACSAPGGKLVHLLETATDLSEVVAVEKDKERIRAIEENLTRSHTEVKVEIICADAADLESWWDKKPFERILLDAPCSASGVIRRHPDIKMLRQPGDIKKLAQEQIKILSALWRTLVPGGILLYATCSIFKEENVDVVRKFLQATPDAREDKIVADWGIACEVGRQILPGMHQMDGFYYARLCKL